ncbi:MAG: Gfo/Idh/MocA family oxidoreductase [Alphaproteobacteria bacterium]|nr:Gfo/Idh/MocA family oxidoreductase [Alphaproteobacteria bacterium]
MVGYRNHAARLISIVEQSGLADVKVVYHPRKQPDVPNVTTDFGALTSQDAVIIASPNASHYEYLTRLSRDFDGYVLCEKPPVSTIAELDALDLDPARFLFNFNFRYSRLVDVIVESLGDGRLGSPLYMNATVCQGLAFKQGYADSWRADAARHLHGVTETKAIHYVDMARVSFGAIGHHQYAPALVSGHGSAFDTSHLWLSHENGTITNLFMSYAAPAVTQVTVVGTNGVVEYRDDAITVRTPRDTFDERGYFVTPPLAYHHDYHGRNGDMYWESLERAVAHFLTHCRDGKPFAASDYHDSLATNRFILELAGGTTND